MNLRLVFRIGLAPAFLAGAVLLGCQQSPEDEVMACHISATIETSSNLSAYERYASFADIISTLSLTNYTGPDTRVYAGLDFEELETADIVVDAKCNALGQDLATLSQEVSASDVDSGTTARFGNVVAQFSEIRQPEIQELGGIYYPSLDSIVPEDCLVRSEASVSVRTDLSQEDATALAHDLLVNMRLRSMQYGVPFADYVIYNDVLIGVLQGRCEHRQEAVSFLAQYWIASHTDDLLGAGATDATVTVTTNNLSMDDLVNMSADAQADAAR